MAAPLVHQVNVKATPETIYKAISTTEGLGAFWTSESKAEPKVGSIASFGFGGPTPADAGRRAGSGQARQMDRPGGLPELGRNDGELGHLPHRDRRDQRHFPPRRLAGVCFAG